MDPEFSDYLFPATKRIYICSISDKVSGDPNILNEVHKIFRCLIFGMYWIYMTIPTPVYKDSNTLFVVVKIYVLQI